MDIKGKQLSYKGSVAITVISILIKIIILFLFAAVHKAIRFKGLGENEKYNSYCELYISASTLFIPFLLINKPHKKRIEWVLA